MYPRKSIFKIFLLLISILILSGCGSGEEIITLDSGVTYADNKIGTGIKAEDGDDVLIHFKAWLINDSTFTFDEKSNDSAVISLGNTYLGKKPIEFTLDKNNFIKGSYMGIEGMRNGGIRTIIIPAEVLYGDLKEKSYPADFYIKLLVELIRIKKNKILPSHK